MKLLAFCCTDTGIFGECAVTGGQLPTGAATPCKEQHKNNQLRQFGLVNGFFLPVSQLLMMREDGRVCLLWLRCCCWGLSVAQYTPNQPWGLLA